jgi:hypothetical protein
MVPKDYTIITTLKRLIRFVDLGTLQIYMIILLHNIDIICNIGIICQEYASNATPLH